MKFTYTDAGRKAAGFNERRDCTVRAIALTSGVDYATAHKLLKEKAKRKNRRAVHFDCHIAEIGKAVGVTYRLIKRSGSVRSLVEQHGGGTLLVQIRGHVFAVLGDVVHDIAPVPENCHVKKAWVATRTTIS